MSEAGSKAVGRVLRGVGGAYRVDVDGKTLECSLRGRLKQQRELVKVAVGDEVELELLPDGSCVIADVHPRKNKLSRKSAHGRREQIIATNLDQLAAVFSTREPEPEFTLLDRFLVLAESSDIPAVVVANKIDLTGEAAAHEQFGLYERIGYRVLYTSAKTVKDVGDLGKQLAGRTTLLAGPSGVGKSTLLNSLQPGLGLAVGEVSRALQKRGGGGGRHTTVQASLHALDSGGYVVDSPGLRKLHFWEVAEHDLGWCFPDIRRYVGGCRFHDCEHMSEPGCAVTDALEAGDIDGGRYDSYARLLGEQKAERAY